VNREPRLRVGLIGCGRIARIVHLGTLLGLPGVELVAIAEADLERRREAAATAPGTVAFSDYTRLLESADVEAVVIALPTHLHAAAAVAALERGVHVYVEKPLARGLEEGAEVLAAWRASGAVGASGFNFRCHPLHMEARTRIAGGDIGKPLAMSGLFCAAPRTVPEWKTARATGGGVLLDLASHHVDLARFLLGSEPSEAGCELRSVRSEDDTAALTIRMDDGVLMQGLYSTTSAEADRIEVHGDEGRLVIDRYGSSALERAGARRGFSRGDRLRGAARLVVATPRRLRHALAAPTDPSFRASLCAFTDAVRSAGAPPADLLDGYRSLAVVVAAERSARDGRRIRIDATTRVDAPLAGRRA
jgi:predicted dehydrogenase